MKLSSVEKTSLVVVCALLVGASGREALRVKGDTGQGESRMHRYKEQREYSNVGGSTSPAAVFDSTVFDLRTMTDSAYTSMYTFWQEVAVSGGQVRPLIVGDVNANGRAELYGYEKLYSTDQFHVPEIIYEQDQMGTFTLVYRHPDSVATPLAKYDIDQDGTEELVYQTTSWQDVVYRCPTQGSLPTAPTIGFNPYAGGEQMDDLTFGDFDKNGKTDAVYILSLNIHSMFISEYDAASNLIDTVYRFRPPRGYNEGFSVGDFDQDGKTDIVMGSSEGDVYVVEAQGVHQYAQVWSGKVETYNAYMHMKTNDIDGNGKPEFWVGGDAYYSGLGMTRFTCFESDGVHSYKPVHRIDFIGVFSFFASNCFAKDIDGDGKEELFICIDQHVMILKSPSRHQYAMYYLKLNEMADSNSVYYGATLSDANGDGKAELFVTMDQVIGINPNQQRRDFTRIYKPTIVDDVQQGNEPLPSGYGLSQNYPNPFNSSTVIRFVVPSGARLGRIRLTVYDMLGREVRKLLDGGQAPGEHSVSWDGRNDAGNVVGSGTYLIGMQADGFFKAIKALYIR